MPTNPSPDNLLRLAAELDPRSNVAAARVNNHCVRVAVNEDSTYEWHHHPRSDELFVVLEGELVIERRDGDAIRLRPGDFWSVPAGVVHRTVARGHTVNLCFEALDTETVFEAPGLAAGATAAESAARSSR